MLSASSLEEYKQALTTNKREAARRLEEFIQTLDMSDIDLAKELFVEFFIELEHTYGDIAATIAADFFEEEALKNGFTPSLGTILASNSDSRVANAARHAFNNFLKTGNIQQMLWSAGIELGKFLHRRANETSRTNARRNKLKYARIPTGAETCGFCIMLASRGFVYDTKKSASKDKEGNHYHPNCDCLAVAGFGDSPQVEGYDRQLYLDIYERNKVFNAKGAIDMHSTVASIRNELMNNQEYRDHVNEVRRAYYARNRDEILRKRHDWIARTGRSSQGLVD